jgi:AraC family transcriptional regulator of adaptative response / DNA-3-methyladenine glycosylase II
VRLSYQPPYDWTTALSFLERRAIEGVEQVTGDIYRRTIRCAGYAGILEVTHDAAGAAMVATTDGLPEALAADAAARVRRMFDLDADVGAIGAYLSSDLSMAPLVAERPGLRVMRGWDGFEVAARTIVGQQVSVARARHLNGVLAARAGSHRPAEGGPLIRAFPTPREVLDADLAGMGMPAARIAALRAIAAAALDDPRLFDRGPTVEATIARLRAIGGVGDWTAHYIAMRACGEPDAFPASDIGLLRGGADAEGRRPTPADLLRRADAWRPWRAYAAHQLWARDSVATSR